MSDMIEQARRIVAERWEYLPSLLPWAEALLAEHDAREQAEAEVKFMREREAHFARALGIADGGRYRNDWTGRLEALLARAEQAERERDEARARLASEFHDESVYGSRSELARRVAALEAALRKIGRYCDDHGGDYFSRHVQDIVYHALGEQDTTPSQPEWCPRCRRTRWTPLRPCNHDWHLAHPNPEDVPAAAPQGEGNTDE